MTLLGIRCHQPLGKADDELRLVAEKIYAPLLRLFENNPRAKCSLRISGIIFDHWAKQQTELLILLTQLVKQGQIELLSGGYYEPILALIPDTDKIGQIERSNEYIKNNFGLAPRGLWLAGRTWEPGLIKIIVRAGIEYALIDDEHFISAGTDPDNLNGYFVTEDEGEMLKVFPVHRRVEEGSFLALEAEQPGRLDQLEKIIKTPTQTFSDYLEEATSLGRIYLPTTGISAKDEEYFRNHLVKNPEANNLHKKMLFVSNKLKTAEQGKNLFGGIKLDQARHELFQGQNSDAYFTEKWRPAAYHHLIMAEKELEKLRRAGKAYVELTLTDFDKDGEDEILLTNDFLSLYFSPRLGGSIFEIDYKPRAVNLCHSRLSLLDHFLAPGTTMAEFSDSGFGEAGDFVQGRYNFMPARKEGAVGLRLSRNGEVQGAPVKIEKNITLHAKHSIFLVEYEITNLWEEPDEFLFGVEFNIDDTKNFAVSLEADKSAVLWCQQNVIMPNWRFKLKPQESWHGKISVRIEE